VLRGRSRSGSGRVGRDEKEEEEKKKRGKRVSVDRTLLYDKNM
jgi:hypothetical protein